MTLYQCNECADFTTTLQHDARFGANVPLCEACHAGISVSRNELALASKYAIALTTIADLQDQVASLQTRLFNSQSA